MIGRLASIVPKLGGAAAPKAGVDRWPVKTGADAGAHAVSAIVQPSTIGALTSIPAPRAPTSRVAPVEMTVYAVPCTITLWKIEADGDHHLVLRDDAGRTMIAEIPDPQLVDASSPWRDQIAAVRAAFDAAPPINRPVVVTGVGFFDHAHGQSGVAPNAIELHPVLSITVQQA